MMNKHSRKWMLLVPVMFEVMWGGPEWAIGKSDLVDEPASLGAADLDQDWNRFSQGAGVRLDLIDQRMADNKMIDVFAGKSWAAPRPKAVVKAPEPAPVVVPEPAPEPTAPPLPYTYFGKLDDGEKVTVFLARNERVYTIVPGDVIDGTYRVENIENGLVNLIYLPLNIKQVLVIGNDS